MIFAPTEINLLGYKINVFDHASVMNIGANQITDQFISYKRNQAFGEQNGDIVPIIIPISYIFDSDLNDSIITKNSII
ncbi:hypothetical protein BIV60_08010 [Bacillus sp. MUM 116]|uniref:Uncharacterized protein n=1 Tax=Bacillus xiapuensis TaxID=2014075 RepID=A0ABU6N6N4_9BACI|nr:hypothetical protein [Bacillus sp. MUM 116]MED3561887.1 hypothetical protein [Bacillus xiapuensis]OIK15776.1 hypothetical protein BIV60_08010 [Bacillus sp. MUM 116]